MDDDAVAASSWLGRPDQSIVGRLVSKLFRDGDSQVFRVRIFVGKGERDRFIQLRLVETRRAGSCFRHSPRGGK